MPCSAFELLLRTNELLLDVIGNSFSCLVRHLDYYLLTFIHVNASLGIQIITTPKNLSSNQPTPRSVSNMYTMPTCRVQQFSTEHYSLVLQMRRPAVAQESPPQPPH